jgi:hypothetical protein
MQCVGKCAQTFVYKPYKSTNACTRILIKFLQRVGKRATKLPHTNFTARIQLRRLHSLLGEASRQGCIELVQLLLTDESVDPGARADCEYYRMIVESLTSSFKTVCPASN